MTDADVVRAYYNGCAEAEWERLETHFIEFELTKRYIDRYVRPGARVIDIGGGPGRYSIHLAGRGCDVTLVDLAEANVELAKRKATEAGVTINARQGDAREVVRLTEGQFDCALLMGPLYHLTDAGERRKCVEAALSLLKPGGLLFTSFISSYAGVIYALKYELPQAVMPENAPFFGRFERDEPLTGDGFTRNYFVRRADVAREFEGFPLDTLALISQEGPLTLAEEKLRGESEDVRARWLDIAEKTCAREDLLSWAEHFLHIARKKGEKA